MNRRELNLAGMFLTLEEFLSNNLSDFEDKPVILNVLAELKSSNQNIRELNESQSISTKADFAIKGNDKKLLIDTAMKVSDGLKVVAATNKDMRLRIEAEITRWELGRMRENDMLVRMKQLNATALTYVHELELMGISKEDIDSLDTDSGKLMKSTPIIKTIKAKKAQATAELGQLILDTNAMIRITLDSLMLQFKNLNPTLYGEYLNARKIIDRPAGYNGKDSARK